MHRLLAIVGVALVLAASVPLVLESPAQAQGWRAGSDRGSAANRDGDRGWRGQGNSGG